MSMSLLNDVQKFIEAHPGCTSGDIADAFAGYSRQRVLQSASKLRHRQFEEERNAVMLEYMKEKDVASMSGRLLNRWGKIKKPQLLARIERLEQHGQTVIPGLTN